LPSAGGTSLKGAKGVCRPFATPFVSQSVPPSRGADGGIYTIVGSTGAEQIGELQVVEVEANW
jgi:hypothetical protein